MRRLLPLPFLFHRYFLYHAQAHYAERFPSGFLQYHSAGAEFHYSGIHSGIPGNGLKESLYTGITKTNGVGIFL